MRIHHRRGAGIAAVVVPGLFVASVLAASVATQDKPPASGKPQRDPIVTPVTGPSWLNLLGVRYSDTTLGRSAATYAAPPGERAARPTPLPLAVGQPVVLSGADLYRLNCQACHRAEGTARRPRSRPSLASSRVSRSRSCDSNYASKGGPTRSPRRARSRPRRGSRFTTASRKAGSGCPRWRICRMPISTRCTPT